MSKLIIILGSCMGRLILEQNQKLQVILSLKSKMTIRFKKRSRTRGKLWQLKHCVSMQLDPVRKSSTNYSEPKIVQGKLETSLCFSAFSIYRQISSHVVMQCLGYS